MMKIPQEHYKLNVQLEGRFWIMKWKLTFRKKAEINKSCCDIMWYEISSRKKKKKKIDLKREEKQNLEYIIKLKIWYLDAILLKKNEGILFITESGHICKKWKNLIS